MAARDFKPVFEALVDRLRTDLGADIKRVTRKNLAAKSFSEAEQPAIVLLALGVDPQGGVGAQPLGHELVAQLVLHSRISGSDESPDDQVLDLIAKIEAALMWRDDEPRSDGIGSWTTLGGKVKWARLEEVAISDDVKDVSQVSTYMRVRMFHR